MATSEPRLARMIWWRRLSSAGDVMNLSIIATTTVTHIVATSAFCATCGPTTAFAIEKTDAKMVKPSILGMEPRLLVVITRCMTTFAAISSAAVSTATH
eukprot:7381165-Prymnesium_polylepis.2